MENAKPQRAYAQKNTELCLRLENAVERQPIIYTYTKSSRNYKIRNLQNDAWSCVATEVGTTIVEAKRLWTNMLCSFRSYRSKVRQSMHTGAAYDAVYRPRWFAYEAMMFMANATEDNEHADT
uniref:MADF domain-containing protein n=1 Tax=Anopheles stephensi TaxID=30069 RepID=A0A182YR19_ANOST